MRPSVLILALTVGVAACGSDSKSGGTTSPSDTTKTNGINISVDSTFAERTAVVGSVLPATVHITKADVPQAGVTVTWAVAPGNGTLSSTSSTSDANGLATTTWTISDTARTNKVTASITGGSSTMTVIGTAGAAKTLARATPDSINVVGGASALLSVRAKDTFGNAVPGVAVSWVASGGRINLTSGTTGSSGSADVVFTTPAGAGSYTVTATGLGGQSVTFKIVGL